MSTRSCGVMATPCPTRTHKHLLPPRRPVRAAKVPNQRRVIVARGTDYAASAADSEVLQLPAKQELDPASLKNVFGYDRDLQGKCDLATCVPDVG